MAGEASFWLQDVGEYVRTLGRQALTQGLRRGVDHAELPHGRPAMRSVELLHPATLQLRVEEILRTISAQSRSS